MILFRYLERKIIDKQNVIQHKNWRNALQLILIGQIYTSVIYSVRLWNKTFSATIYKVFWINNKTFLGNKYEVKDWMEFARP